MSKNIKSFIKHLKENLELTPAHVRIIHRLIKLDNENVPLNWQSVGRKRIISVDEMYKPILKKIKR